MNCRTLWRITKTTAGACLELDTKTVLERDKAMTIMQSDKSAKMKRYDSYHTTESTDDVSFHATMFRFQLQESENTRT